MIKTRNKKIISVLVMMTLVLSCNISFSQSDGFFNKWSELENRGDEGLLAPSVPTHGQGDDQPAPVGSGIAVLVVLAAGYAALKRKPGWKKTMTSLLVLLSLPALSQQLEYDWVVKKVGENPMSVVAIVVEDGVRMTNAQYEIGAFCGDECRGKAYCNVAAAGNYAAYINVFGSTGDNFTFKVYDHNNQWVVFADCGTNIDFDNSGSIGTQLDPVQVEITKTNYIFHGGSPSVLGNYTLSNDNTPVKLPLRNCKVIFEEDVVFTDGNVELKDVIVSTDKKVTIDAGSGLTAMETVQNPNGVDGIWIMAAAPQTGAKGDYWDEKFSSVGSLVTVAPGVEGTMQVYLDNSATEHDWHLVSSPVAGQVIYNGMIANDFTPSKSDDFYLYDETGAMWRNIKTDDFSVGNQFHAINNNSFDFVPGRGYLVSYSEQGVRQFSGVFNHGDVTVGMTRTESIDDEPNRYAGFNLIGNPYPSFLDWENVEGWDRSRIYGYNAKPDESHCVMWIYNEDEGNYSVYVQGGGSISTLNATQYIAPGQGFFVKATQAGDFVMRDAARTNEHAKSGFMKGQDLQDLQDVLKIRVENEELGADEVVLALSENVMKIEKMFSMSETAPAMYLDNEDGKYSIILDSEFGKSIPLNFKAKQMGKYTIKLNPETTGFDFVELEDSFTGEKVNLLTEDYPFYATKNDAENRFMLNLGNNKDVINSDNFVFRKGNNLIVKGKGHLQVVDVLGRKIFEKELTGDENVISCDYINKGINIFKIENKSQKIVIR